MEPNRLRHLRAEPAAEETGPDLLVPAVDAAFRRLLEVGVDDMADIVQQRGDHERVVRALRNRPGGGLAGVGALIDGLHAVAFGPGRLQKGDQPVDRGRRIGRRRGRRGGGRPGAGLGFGVGFGHSRVSVVPGADHATRCPAVQTPRITG